MKSLINFMEATPGRVLRVVLGLVLIYFGLAVIGGITGVIVTIVGIAPIVFGVWGPCLLSFIFKQPHRA